MIRWMLAIWVYRSMDFEKVDYLGFPKKNYNFLAINT